jgi:flagellar basal-body rod modification protein FlgD
MATVQGIWNQAAAQSTAATLNANPTANTTSSSSSSTSSSSSDVATISSSDFLTLLVTEMQNQDPTASTDPNEYINQLVNVNSLQQLISINQTLTDAVGTTTTTTSSAQSSSTGSTAVATQASQAAQATTSTPSTLSTAAATTAGNLSVPHSSTSASRLANALNGTHL